MTIQFFVPGTPAPQGSKRHVGNGVMIESSKAVKPWRLAVACIGREEMQRREMAALVGPLALQVNFFLTPPVSLTKKRLALGPCRKPDADKLLRSTMDGLTEAGVWGDDGQVVSLYARKLYCDGANPSPGAQIFIAESHNASQ